MPLKFSLTLPPARIIECAGMLPLNIYELASECEKAQSFLLSLCEIATANGFGVHRINFNDHTSIEQAFRQTALAPLMQNEFSKIEPRLFIFENADCLAPLSQSLTYSLRSRVTTRYEHIEVFVFVASHENLRAIFHHRDAAFYLSSTELYRVV